MHILRIENEVPEYDSWKKMFDSDPLDRKGSGVRRARVMRAVDDPSRIMIDLEFESADEAARMQTGLKELWTRVDVMKNPQVLSVEVLETLDY